MTEEKLFTIDELMEGKAPGSVKITQPEMKSDYYMEPFFLGCNGWVCRSSDNQMYAFRSTSTRRWKLYTEPKKKKVLRPAVIRYSDNSKKFRVTDDLYESEDEARKVCASGIFLCMAPDSYAVEVEE